MDFSARVTGCKIITKIYLIKGFFQIFLHPDDIPSSSHTDKKENKIFLTFKEIQKGSVSKLHI
jgi:hypothetical protein